MRPLTFHPPVVAASGGSLRSWRGQCGTCQACLAGWEAWCVAWNEPGSTDRWSPPVTLPTSSPAAAVVATIVLDVVATSARPGDVVLLVGAGDDAREAPGLLSGRGVVVLAEAGDRDRLSAATRSALATLSGSGRADVIVTFGPSLARCGRWVRRGGTIAAGTPTSQGPPLDYLVMREVRIAGVRRPHMRLEGLAS